MKNLSFWQWLGLLILISVVGGILWKLLYGKKWIDAQLQLANKAKETT